MKNEMRKKNVPLTVKSCIFVIVIAIGSTFRRLKLLRSCLKVPAYCSGPNDRL